MNWRSIFNRNNTNTASIAKDRLLTVLVAREGGDIATPDFLPKLQREILEVVRKYIQIDESQINITRDKEGDCEVLILNLPMPERPKYEAVPKPPEQRRPQPSPIRNAKPCSGPDGRKPF